MSKMNGLFARWYLVMSELKSDQPKRVKEPWVLMPDVYKTKAAYMSWLRGGIRRALWNNAPVKIKFIHANRIRIPNPNPKGRVPEVWGGRCALTGKLFPSNQLQVDHIDGGRYSLRDIPDIQSFVESIVMVGMDDLQFVSTEAHKVKSYADKQGISFEQATAEKQAIKLQKEKKDVDFIKDSGIIPAKNAKDRRAQLVEILLK